MNDRWREAGTVWELPPGDRAVERSEQTSKGGAKGLLNLSQEFKCNGELGGKVEALREVAGSRSRTMMQLTKLLVTGKTAMCRGFPRKEHMGPGRG